MAIKYNSNTVNEMEYNTSPVKKVMYNSTVAYIRKVRENIYRWVVDGYICDGVDDHDKYQKLVKLVSIDGGDSWQKVIPEESMKGELIEAQSTDCGYVPGDLYLIRYILNGTETIVDCGQSTAIIDRAYIGQNITEAQIGSCCQTIGNYSFQSCSYLTSITLSNTVTTIGHETFQDASAFSSITIPSSVTEIGFWCFARNTALEEVIFESETVFTPGKYGYSMTAIFHDKYPTVVYVPDNAVNDYRAKGINWWIDGVSDYPDINTWIKPISEKV